MPRKINIRSTAFEDPTDPYAAYWAGFMAADGCIKASGKNKSLYLSIGLAEKDTEHLQTFRTWLRSTHTIGYRTATRSSHLTIGDKQLIKDLMEIWNIHPRKSLTLEPPNCAPAVYTHYLRGLFDGDGHFGIYKRTLKPKNGKEYPYTAAQISVVLAPTMTDWLFTQLPRRKVSIHPGGNVRCVQWTSVQDLLHVGDYLYQDSTATTRLDRKYCIWQQMRGLLNGRRRNNKKV